MLLKKLTEANAVSGNENSVREIIISEIEKYCTNVKVDKMGNVIAFKQGTEGNHNSIMLSAHMDEVGFIVTGITDKGYINFKPVGSVDDRVLLSKKVTIGDAKVSGVIGLRAVHLQKPEERRQIVKVKDMYIDIGTKNKAEAEKKVQLGDYIAFDSEFISFGDNRIKAKALDDRVGCAVLVEMLKEDFPSDVYACFTVQEEVGLRGAQVAAYNVNPHVAIVVEGTTCSDVPGADEHEYSTVMGEGAAISFMDKSSYADKRLLSFLYELAQKHKVNVQYKRTVSGGNDSGKIQLSGNGTVTCVISVPVRYIHSPVSVMKLDDYESVKSLVKLFLNEVNSFIDNHIMQN